MKTLYIDCQMGAAGDMLTAALMELLPDADAFVREVNSLGLPEVSMERKDAVKCGIHGTYVDVRICEQEEAAAEATEEPCTDLEEHGHHHHHHGRSLQEIRQLIDSLPMSAKVKRDVKAVYGLIAEAESHVHRMPVTEVHFHEVGAMDAIADITAVCMLMERIAPERVVVSPIHVGSGQIRCEHGVLPVPAPATAHILQGVPTYGGTIRGELCTPTGAALLKYFADEFGTAPVMRTTAIGYGMGTKDFEAANCIRVMLGEQQDQTDTVAELSCNVDDMTAEAIAFAMERLLDAGAPEVFTTPIGMKKSRPGTMLTVLCRPEQKTEIIPLIFRYTTTLGIRETICRRYVLQREGTSVRTPYGEVRRKESEGYGVSRAKYEYEDLARIAREQDMTLQEAAELAENCQ